MIASGSGVFWRYGAPWAAAALLALAPVCVQAKDTFSLTKAFGAGFVEVGGADAEALLVSNTRLPHGQRSDTRYQMDDRSAIFYTARSRFCKREERKLTPTEDCHEWPTDPDKTCVPYRVFKKRGVDAAKAPKGELLGYYVEKDKGYLDKILFDDREAIVRGNVSGCPPLEFDTAAEALRASADDLAKISALDGGETDKNGALPDGLTRRLLVGNSLVKTAGRTHAVTYFAADGRIISAGCDGEPSLADCDYAYVFDSWRALAEPTCTPDVAYLCKRAKGPKDRQNPGLPSQPSVGNERICLDNIENPGSFDQCDPFTFRIKTIGDGAEAKPAIEVDYKGVDGFPAIIYRGDVMGLANFPKK